MNASSQLRYLRQFELQRLFENSWKCVNFLEFLAFPQFHQQITESESMKPLQFGNKIINVESQKSNDFSTLISHHYIKNLCRENPYKGALYSETCLINMAFVLSSAGQFNSNRGYKIEHFEIRGFLWCKAIWFEVFWIF